MKQTQLTPRIAHAFTLVEMLVVIAIIGILAGLLLPVLANAKKKTRITQARTTISEIVVAISAYEADYNRYPATNAIESQITGGDFTYASGLFTTGQPVDYDNSLVMAILLGDASHLARNPRKSRFLNAKLVADGGSGGIGTTDRIFRDPWGTPYVISIDLSGDDRCEDALYRTLLDGNSVGLSPINPPPPGNPAAPPWFLAGGVMVWSFGPDKSFNDAAGASAIGGANKDNVLGWTQK